MSNLGSELDGSLGSLFFAGFFSLVLYGCTCGQVLYYFSHYGSADHRYITSLVILVWILDTSKTIVDMICGWDLLVRVHDSASDLLGKLPGITPGEFILSPCTIFMVQCCYLHTIWKLLKRPHRRWHWLLYTLLPFILALVSLGAGLAGAVQIGIAENIDQADSKAELAGAIRPGFSAVVDIYITVWLCYQLQGSRSGLKQSDNMVTKLISYAITRGICTSVVQAGAFALQIFLVDSHNKTLFSMILYIPASTLYVNSLLAMWNALLRT
ncbi:hypothetical protein DAEQUDRAFT_758695, partial [Daedalea quercina L-15889]